MLLLWWHRKRKNYILTKINIDEHNVWDILREYNIKTILRAENILWWVKFELIDTAENVYNTIVLKDEELNNLYI